MVTSVLQKFLFSSITEMSGEILNPESVMEYHPQSGILSVNFRNMVTTNWTFPRLITWAYDSMKNGILLEGESQSEKSCSL